MKWIKVITPRKRPKKGNYSSWKPQIAEDCSHRCVYCAITEARYGGIDNFHVDHFRPKAHFVALKNDINNLFLACGICNRFKSDDWPSEPCPKHTKPAYPDPSAHDFSTLFSVDQKTFTVAGKYVAAQYVAERLYLNRPQLIMERRQAAIEAAFTEFQGFLDVSLPLLAHAPKTLLHETIVAISKITKMKDQLHACQPYTLTQIRRPANSPLRRRKYTPRKSPGTQRQPTAHIT